MLALRGQDSARGRTCFFSYIAFWENLGINAFITHEGGGHFAVAEFSFSPNTARALQYLTTAPKKKTKQKKEHRLPRYVLDVSIRFKKPILASKTLWVVGGLSSLSLHAMETDEWIEWLWPPFTCTPLRLLLQLWANQLNKDSVSSLLHISNKCRGEIIYFSYSISLRLSPFEYKCVHSSSLLMLSSPMLSITLH